MDREGSERSLEAEQSRSSDSSLAERIEAAETRIFDLDRRIDDLVRQLGSEESSHSLRWAESLQARLNDLTERLEFYDERDGRIETLLDEFRPGSASQSLQSNPALESRLDDLASRLEHHDDIINFHGLQFATMETSIGSQTFDIIRFQQEAVNRQETADTTTLLQDRINRGLLDVWNQMVQQLREGERGTSRPRTLVAGLQREIGALRSEVQAARCRCSIPDQGDSTGISAIDDSFPPFYSRTSPTDNRTPPFDTGAPPFTNRTPPLDNSTPARESSSPAWENRTLPFGNSTPPFGNQRQTRSLSSSTIPEVRTRRTPLAQPVRHNGRPRLDDAALPLSAQLLRVTPLTIHRSLSQPLATGLGGLGGLGLRAAGYRLRRPYTPGHGLGEFHGSPAYWASRNWRVVEAWGHQHIYRFGSIEPPMHIEEAAPEEPRSPQTHGEQQDSTEARPDPAPGSPTTEEHQEGSDQQESNDA